MRLFVLVSVLCLGVFVALGCSAVHKAITNYEICKGDSGCLAKMQIADDTAKKVVTDSGLPNILGIVAGALASLVTGMIYGRKVASKKAVM